MEGGGGYSVRTWMGDTDVLVGWGMQMCWCADVLHVHADGWHVEGIGIKKNKEKS